MCESALEKLKRQRAGLSREIEALQKKPACYSLEMERYKIECQNIERRIVTLEQGQTSRSSVVSSVSLDQPKPQQPKSV
jgi:hypothetical protein